MKTATVKELKQGLQYKSQSELVELCLRLSKFKKENKELLTYLLFEAADEDSFIQSVKNEMRSDFEMINTKSYFYIKKSVRRILRNTKKYMRYSKKKRPKLNCCFTFVSN